MKKNMKRMMGWIFTAVLICCIGFTTKGVTADAAIVSGGKKNYSYSELQKDLQQLKKKYKNHCQVNVIGKSEDKRNLLKIDSSINGKLFKKSSIKLPDYHLKANETSPYLYYYLTKEDKIGFSSFSKYYVRKGKNTLRNSYLEDGLGYVENVIRPLDIMYNLYKSGKLLNEYYEEIEALFIRDIFLEIERVKRNVHPEDTSVKLINILLKYLNFHFPNWRSNRYLKKNFIDFNKDIFFKLNRISLEMKHFKTRGVIDSSEAIRSFIRVLK